MHWHRLGALALALSLSLASCAPQAHRAARYRFDPALASRVEAKARAECGHEPEHAFLTDGCSMWLDGWFTGSSWQECCVDHDVVYWCGGPGSRRSKADEALRGCVADEFQGWMGGVMWMGVRLGGHPWVPAYWRWGYGNDWPSSYTPEPATPAQSD